MISTVRMEHAKEGLYSLDPKVRDCSRGSYEFDLGCGTQVHQRMKSVGIMHAKSFQDPSHHYTSRCESARL